MASTLIRKVVKFLKPPDFGSLARGTLQTERAQAIIQVFYYFFLLIAYLRLVWRLPEPWVNPGDFAPIWPVLWTRYVAFDSFASIFPNLLLVTAFMGAVFYKYWWGRFVAFFGILQFVSFQASFKSPIHYYEWYPWLFGSFIFIFLPSLAKQLNKFSLEEKRRVLLVVWGFQAFFLLTFTNVGVSRIIGIIQQTTRGELNLLNPAGYAAQLAEYNIQQPFINPTARTIIENPLYAYPLVILSLYFFLFSFWAAFRPRILRIWAFFLLLNEIIFYIITTSFFYPNIFLLSLLIFESPFLARSSSVSDILVDAPIFGVLLKMVRK